MIGPNQAGQLVSMEQHHAIDRQLSTLLQAYAQYSCRRSVCGGRHHFHGVAGRHSCRAVSHRRARRSKRRWPTVCGTSASALRMIGRNRRIPDRQELTCQRRDDRKILGRPYQDAASCQVQEQNGKPNTSEPRLRRFGARDQRVKSTNSAIS